MGVQIRFPINKGTFSGTIWTVVEPQSVRIEQIGVKNTEAYNFPVAPVDYGNAAYPVTMLTDNLLINKTFRLSGVLTTSGNRYAIDKKRMLTDMCDSGGTGSLILNLVPDASGTTTGSESWIVNFLNYNFIHDTASVNKYEYTLMLIAGSQLYK